MEKVWRAAAVVFVLVSGAIGDPAHAQVTPQIAACAELRDAAPRRLMASCDAHIGCAMILKLQTTCPAAKGFLSRLTDAMAGRPEITNNDVFEANTPPLMSSPALRSQIVIVRKTVQDAADDPARGTREIKWPEVKGFYYEGGLLGGLRFGTLHGVGVAIKGDGSMQRGRYENGALLGQIQTVTTAAAVFAGVRAPSGHQTGVSQFPNGLVGVGTVGAGGGLVGLWEFTESSGNTYTVLYGADGKPVAR